MEKSAIDSFEAVMDMYPLTIYSITPREKEMIVAILRLGRVRRIFSQVEVEAQGGFSLRYIIGPKDQKADGNADIAHNAASDRKVEKKVDVAYEKWVFLYSYIMGDFAKLCAVKRADELILKIEELYDESLKSGRYANDMHLFNKRYLHIDTSDAKISRDHYGYHIGFRFNSTGKLVVISVLEIFQSERPGNPRNVFRERVISESVDRYTRGLVYESSGNLFLFGYMNYKGYEFCAVRSDSRDNSIMFGIASMVDRHGMPHAKHCCQIRAELIDGLPRLDATIWNEESKKFAALRNAVEVFVDPVALTVKLVGGRKPYPLRRHMDPKSIVRCRNADLA